MAALLGVPHISLDELYWQPGWKESTREEFQARIRQRLDQDHRGWIVDGEYDHQGGDMVLPESTDLICKDKNIEGLTSVNLFGIPRA